MKKDILLIVPPSDSFRMAEEHLGVGYLGAILEKGKIKTGIIDGYLGNLEIKEIKKRIEAARPKIFGFSLYQDSLGPFCELAKFIRQKLPDAYIGVGGFLATFNYDWLFLKYPNLIDFIVRGEGEIIFCEIAKRILSKKNYKNTTGIAFIKGSKIFKNPPMPKIADLDSIPFPLRPTIKETIYRKNPVHICGSRGCYGNCSFCAVNAFGYVSPGKNGGEDQLKTSLKK